MQTTPPVRLLLGEAVPCPQTINLTDDLLVRTLYVEEQPRRLRKRKKISYDIGAQQKEERRQSRIAAMAYRREQAMEATKKRRAERNLRKEEKRRKREADRWTRPKKDELMLKFNRLRELSTTNHGHFKQEEEIASIYEEYGYSLNMFRRFKKECLDRMQMSILNHLENEERVHQQHGTPAQFKSMVRLYEELQTTMDNDTHITEPEMDVFYRKINSFLDGLGFQQIDGEYEVDVDELSFVQSNQFIRFLTDTLTDFKYLVYRRKSEKHEYEKSKLSSAFKKYLKKH